MTSELPNTPLSAKITPLVCGNDDASVPVEPVGVLAERSAQHPFNRLPSVKDVVEHLALAGVLVRPAAGRRPLLVKLLLRVGLVLRTVRTGYHDAAPWRSSLARRSRSRSRAADSSAAALSAARRSQSVRCMPASSAALRQAPYCPGVAPSDTLSVRLTAIRSLPGPAAFSLPAAYLSTITPHLVQKAQYPPYIAPSKRLTNGGHHFSPMAGTIMEHSSTSMRFWFYAMYLMASTRCGISAKQLGRELGVTYKTAWRMFKQIRSMLTEDITEDITLEGLSVEIDATLVGGKAKNMHKAKRERLGRRGTVGKTAVLGMVERQGNVVTAIVGEESQNAVLPNVREKVLPRSLIYSDEHAAYNPLRSMGYQHRRVHHAAKVYVQGDAHTNTIEGFWSLVKRGISGVNHSVSEKYLQSYLNEYSFQV